ncbi:MAG: FAD:protein FMN transferase [Spirochaetes bacterium]|nr:FAD:protein FMN transferase [Spirochaetota bacterium]
MKKILLMLFMFLLSSCMKEKIYSEMKFLLGTEVTITLTASTPAKAYSAFDAAFAEFKKVNDTMNTFSPESDVYKVNKNAGIRPVEVSADTLNVIKKSIEISELTDGAFDITFGPLGEIWDFKMNPFIPPTETSIKSAQKAVNYRFIEIKDDAVFLENANSRIGVGGIAKGYSVQLAINALERTGIKNAVVNAGGDIKVMGSKNGKEWRSAVQHPRENRFIAILPVKDGESVVTSGDYERVAFYKGQRYHHIIDTKSGRPTSTFSSVTVVMSDPEYADALATSFFVMGLEKTKKFLEQHSDISVLLIDLDLKVYASENLKSRLEFPEPVDVEWF